MPDIIAILTKFKHVDKYSAFGSILPSAINTPEEQKVAVSGILDNCCSALLSAFESGKRKPAAVLLRSHLIECMDMLSIANINAENREFGYQLGWYLAEKVKINLGKGTEKKVWGYWQIEGSEVRMPIKPKVSSKAREKVTPKKKKEPSKETGMF